jgi:hypothetical protein
LKKRTKKLFSIGARATAGAKAPAPQPFHRWNACGAWFLSARSAREKFFGSFFQKRTSLPFALSA